jgi:uncharacterized protein YaaR (DUF327 family)
MKVSKSFSITQEKLIKYLIYCEKNSIDPNQNIEKYMDKVTEDANIFITCQKCGANYTSKLAKCPACDLNLMKVDEEKEKEKKIQYYNDQISKLTKRLADNPEVDVINYIKDQIAGYESKILKSRGMTTNATI